MADGGPQEKSSNAVTLFVQSLHDISHNKIEDTKEAHLEMCVIAFDRHADKAIRWIQCSPQV